MMYFIFLIILNSILFYVRCSLVTEYYEKLITQQMSKTEKYELPVNNEEFKMGLESNTNSDFGSYDFIIVGAGTAGSTLATRLSEIDHFNILLLESGGEENDFSKIPFLYSYSIFSEMNWGYYTTSQKHSCLGMRNKQCYLPRGKAVGGSSSINGVGYVRGNAHDYDNWNKLGNPGWSYKDVLPYFIKSENSQIEGDKGFHGKGGLWNVEYGLPPSVLFSTFINASEEIIGITKDYNGIKQFGSSQMQYNTKRGVRQSTGTAFLDYARKRKNLKVVTKALATKIIIDPKTKITKGIEFVTKNQKFHATAEKEVIISAGAINSPQLLMLSGIGPKNHLQQLGIKVLADLPVGKHLLDHPSFPGFIFRTNYTMPNQTIEDLVEQYLQGSFTKGSGIDGVGFINTNKGQKVPTIEYTVVFPSGISLPITNNVHNYDRDVANFMSKLNPNTDIQIFLILLHEKSKGEITLKSTSPLDFPNIDLNMFAEKEDIDTYIKGIKFILELFNTEPFQKVNARLLDIPICTQLEKYSNKYWECVLRQVATTTYHICSTTRMGPNGSIAVVDHSLKVHGIKSLRIVDAGVMPSTISGHLAAPTVMIAEKIADVIKQEYIH